jgi:hypothetical protein
VQRLRTRTCAPLRGIQGVEQYQSRVIDLCIGVAEGLPQRRGEPLAERIALQLQCA